MLLDDLIAGEENNYSESLCLLGGPFRGPGYHSLIENGTWVHTTRSSINYAYLLLKTNNPKYIERAFKIISKIISLQDTNSYNDTYGIWSWVYEEPVDKMSPPDWNWADFIGAALAHIYKDFETLLPDDLKKKMKQSLGHAAYAIFRRNVQPGYTNIAIMGGFVTAAAGEILNDHRLTDYAGQRIKTFLEYTKDQGGLNEYNSPCYSFIALHETERIVHLVHSPEVRAYAEKLRHVIWDNISKRYHPKTKQLAGPHSRSYRDLLNDETAGYIDWAISGKSIDEYEAYSLNDLICPMPCPDKFKQKFITFDGEVEVRDRFIKLEPDEQSFYGTTWMSEDATLGTINHECFWAQRRPLIGYWPDVDGKPAVLRLRFIKDGKDFSPGAIYNTQVKNRVLSGFKMYTDRGDYHTHLDRPEDGVYSLNSLRLCYELTGAGAQINHLGDEVYELTCGERKAIISTADGNFNGAPIEWRIVKDEGVASLEAVIYEGAEKEVPINETTFMQLVISTELLERDEVHDSEIPTVKLKDKMIEASWKNLDLTYSPYGEGYC